MTENQSSPAPLGRWPQSQRPMGIGFIMPISDLSAFGGTPRFRDMLEMTQVAEELGYDAVWIPDHFLYFYEQEPTRRGVWEAWTTLAGIAAATSRITLGVYVTCLGWRNPGIVAKMAENLDEISGGRFVLGIGAGLERTGVQDVRDAIRPSLPALRGCDQDHPTVPPRGEGRPSGRPTTRRTRR